MEPLDNLIARVQNDQKEASALITDPHIRDNPIVFVNNAFCSLTGFDRLEVLGKNCRFLQGVDTSLEALERIRASIKSQERIDITILNYRKNGTRFWNRLSIRPAFGDDGQLENFLGLQHHVSGPDLVSSV